MDSTDSFTQPLPVCTNATHAELLALGTYRCDSCGRAFEEPPERCPHSVLLTKRDLRTGTGRATFCSICTAPEMPVRTKTSITRDRDWLDRRSRVSQIAREKNESELEFEPTEDEQSEESDNEVETESSEDDEETNV